MTDAARYGRVGDVNTTDIAGAIHLGCRTMQRVFNPDDRDRPYMIAQARPDARLADSVTYGGHVPGRHLNALLSAEDALGVELDEGAVEKHRQAALFSYGGPVALPLHRRDRQGPLAAFAGHDLREGFHALYALTAYRADERARELAEASVATVTGLWDPDRGWDLERLRREYGLSVDDKDENFARTLPRAIGPLVKHYRAAGSGTALDLAVAMKDKLLRDHFPPDGAYDIELQGTHGHSIACDLSSMAQLAELTADASLIDRVRAFYDNGMWELRDELGWVVEKTGQSRIDRPDVGEINSTGDLVETALVLGRWGLPQYFEDAERMLRCHLLPAQLRDTGFIVESPDSERIDARRDVADRLRGGFGFPAPYGHEPLELTGFDAVLFHLDIVGGAVGSLCEAYRSATRFDEAGHHVDLLFDRETEAIAVESIYTHEALSVTLKKPGPLWVRIPSWLRREDIAIRGACGPHRFTGSHLFVPTQPVGVPVRLHHELPTRRIVLHHSTRDIHVRMRGDAVEAMDSFGADLTFFDPL